MTIAAVLKILKEVTQWGPVIAEAGKKIYENTRGMFGNDLLSKKPSLTVTLQELDRKVAQLEQNDLDQTKLLAEMAQQTDNLSKLTSGLVTRIKYAHITAAISLIIAIYLLMRTLL
jgi:predicted PurR-regulated permease PerM